jgi:hypothetical protein
MGLFSFGSNAVRFSLQVLALFGLLRNIIYLGSHLFPAILAVSQKYIIFLGMFFLFDFFFIFYLSRTSFAVAVVSSGFLPLHKQRRKQRKTTKKINASLYKNVKLTCMCIY